MWVLLMYVVTVCGCERNGSNYVGVVGAVGGLGMWVQWM